MGTESQSQLKSRSTTCARESTRIAPPGLGGLLVNTSTGLHRFTPVAKACRPSGTHAPVLLSTVLVGVPEK